MLKLKSLRNIVSGNNVVPLVAVTLFIFFYLILVLSFNYVKFLNEMEVAIAQGSLDSHKMRLNSELMEVARSRTRITNQIIDESDPFEQDELSLELDKLAGRFARLREELIALELTDNERKVLLEEHPEIVTAILPAQRKAVQLAMNDDPADKYQARRILYLTVLPGQGRMIESFSEMIEKEQERIEEVSRSAQAKAVDTKSKGYVLITLVAGISLVMSVLVLFHIRRIQTALLASYENLEKTVEKRTEELSNATDELQRYVDLVDKYVITSHTNEHGIITYTSDAFCKISQYSESELIGHPHSIVRHPDMPRALYEELWSTIKQGKSWQGEIKNRAKDGSAYWVDVNIEPQFDNRGDISGYVAFRQDITDKKRIEQLSITDVLTQLNNRLKLDKTLDEEINRANRYHDPLSVILLDIDFFKKVNDTYGHQAGDAVLVEVADIIRKKIRTTDVAGRWGGEEFLIICSHTGLEGASELAERIRFAIASHQFEDVGQVTSSFGVAMLIQNELEKELMSRADMALYEAKQAGRNRVQVAS